MRLHHPSLISDLCLPPGPAACSGPSTPAVAQLSQPEQQGQPLIVLGEISDDRGEVIAGTRNRGRGMLKLIQDPPLP